MVEKQLCNLPLTLTLLGTNMRDWCAPRLEGETVVRESEVARWSPKSTDTHKHARTHAHTHTVP